MKSSWPISRVKMKLNGTCRELFQSPSSGVDVMSDAGSRCTVFVAKE
jgi:hypothetical protein